MTCDVCGCAVHSHESFGPNQCASCGAYDIDHFTEFRDVIVEVRMVGEDFDDQREPRFDTEKEVLIHTQGEHTRIDNDGDVWHQERTFSFRGQDEIGFMGMFVHGDIHGTFVAEVDKVRVEVLEDEKHDDIDASVEMQCGGQFRNIKERRY